ncbi:MAG: ComEA family DNA-binding protein [bacterium]
MPTSSEQKALAFIAIVILLGGAVRVVRAGSATNPTVGEQQAIARQATAADSAAASKHRSKDAKRTTSKRAARNTVPNVVGGVASVPPTFARPDRPYDHTPYGAPSGRNGFPPPLPRIDTDARGLRASAPVAKPPAKRHGDGTGPLDIDTATQQEIETLPRIGPTFAQRIVANRDSLGPFGSLDGLKRVKGMGKATIAQLASLVTFSGSRRSH